MNLVSDLDLGWLAKSPLAYIVLDHDSGEFFLRSRATAFPGRPIAEFSGVTGCPPIIWPGSSKLNHGPGPDV